MAGWFLADQDLNVQVFGERSSEEHRKKAHEGGLAK